MHEYITGTCMIATKVDCGKRMRLDFTHNMHVEATGLRPTQFVLHLILAIPSSPLVLGGPGDLLLLPDDMAHKSLLAQRQKIIPIIPQPGFLYGLFRHMCIKKWYVYVTLFLLYLNSCSTCTCKHRLAVSTGIHGAAPCNVVNSSQPTPSPSCTLPTGHEVFDVPQPPSPTAHECHPAHGNGH